VILFGLPRTAALAAAVAPLAGCREGCAVVQRFANGELHAALDTPPAGEACALVGAVAPPDADLLSTLLLAHTLGENGAASVTAVLPYLGYARQDRREPGRSRAAAWLGRLLAACGVQEVVTVDVHSPLIHELFPVPVRSLSPAPLVAAEIAAGGVDDLCIVAPDAGAIARSDAVRTAARVTHPLVWLDKRRTPDGVVHRALHGTPLPRAVVVDDILDTGGTLLSACEALRDAGVREIVVAVTHGLFTGTAWRRLATLGVTRIVCTDTTTPPVSAGPVTVLSVAPLLAAHLAAGTAVAVPGLQEGPR
jgi:ribose-phosphate pyrophosphokinase